MKIREATAADLNDLVTLTMALGEVEREWHVHKDPLSLPDGAARMVRDILSWLLAVDHKVFVAESKAGLVGFIHASFVALAGGDPSTASVLQAYVVPGNPAVFGRLSLEVIRLLRSYGVTKIQYETDPHNEKMRRTFGRGRAKLVSLTHEINIGGGHEFWDKCCDKVGQPGSRQRDGGDRQPAGAAGSDDRGAAGDYQQLSLFPELVP